MSQNAKILSHLKTGRCLDPMMALRKFGCFRLAARIEELRHFGHPIETRMIKTRTGKRVGVYRLLHQL